MIIKARRGERFPDKLLQHMSVYQQSSNEKKLSQRIPFAAALTLEVCTGFTSVVSPHKNLSQQIQFKSKRPEVFPLFFSRFLKLAHFFQKYTHVIDITSFLYDSFFYKISLHLFHSCIINKQQKS